MKKSLGLKPALKISRLKEYRKERRALINGEKRVHASGVPSGGRISGEQKDRNSRNQRTNKGGRSAPKVSRIGANNRVLFERKKGNRLRQN